MYVKTGTFVHIIIISCSVDSDKNHIIRLDVRKSDHTAFRSIHYKDVRIKRSNLYLLSSIGIYIIKLMCIILNVV